MNIQNLINQFSTSNNSPDNNKAPSRSLDSLTSKIPGGLAGGAAAGGIMALLLGNKSGRKFAGKVAKYGGTALLGGMAFKAYQNYKQNKSYADNQPVTQQEVELAQEQIPQQIESTQTPVSLVIIKAMIGAAKSDGEVDSSEQMKIFEAVDKLQLNSDEKGMVFDLMRQDINVHEIASGMNDLEQKAEVYLAAYLCIEPDHPKEMAYLDDLATALDLPPDFITHLHNQVATEVNH